MRIGLKIILFFITFSLNGFCFSQNTETTDYYPEELSRGFFLLDQNQFQEAENTFQNHLATLKTNQEKKETCLIISRRYNTSLYFDLSITYAKEGLNYEPLNSELNKSLYQVIANNYLDLRNYSLAEDYYLKSVQEDSITARNSTDYNLIGEILRLKGSQVESLEYFNKAISTAINNNDEAILSVLFNNIGLAYLEIGNIDSTEYYLNRSLIIINELNLTNRKSAINISFGQFYLTKNEVDKALDFYQNTIEYDLSKHPDRFELFRDSYNGMWICYEKLQKYEEALAAYKKYHEFQSKILDYTKQAAIFQNQILNERANHESELELLSVQIKLENRYRNILLLLLIIAMFIVLLLIYILWLRTKTIRQKITLAKKNKLIHELEFEKIKLLNDRLQTENVQSKQEKLIKELERNQLKEQLDFKNRELTATALHLLNKNEILTQIDESLSELVFTNSENSLKSVRDIQFSIKQNLHLDEDWKEFNKHFTEVHPDFFSKLKLNFSELTPDELKLCAYLKIQLSSKEIARLINITVVAVNKRRNRLRKKLNLSSDIDLNEFLLHIN